MQREESSLGHPAKGWSAGKETPVGIVYRRALHVQGATLFAARPRAASGVAAAASARTFLRRRDGRRRERRESQRDQEDVFHVRISFEAEWEVTLPDTMGKRASRLRPAGWQVVLKALTAFRGESREQTPLNAGAAPPVAPSEPSNVRCAPCRAPARGMTQATWSGQRTEPAPPTPHNTGVHRLPARPGTPDNPGGTNVPHNRLAPRVPAPSGPPPAAGTAR